MPQKPSGYWDDFANVERELRSFIARYSQTGIMPTKRTLQAAGLNGLVSGISKHGGVFVVAKRLGLEIGASHKPSGYWKNFDNLRSELVNFARDHEETGLMPSRSELEAAKRGDLITATQKHGGPKKVAERAGLKQKRNRQEQGYWNNFDNLEREIRAFVAEHQIEPGFMPTIIQMNAVGRTNLVNAIRKYGGIAKVAERLGLQRTQPNKPAGYWDDSKNLEKELLQFIEKSGIASVMPTTNQLESAGRSDLIMAMLRHGGILVVAEKLGLSRPDANRVAGYWNDFTNVEKELINYIGEYGTSGLMPSTKELNKSGHSGLVFAFRRHGGYRAVAKRLGLKVANRDKPPKYWDDFSNVENELRQYISQFGQDGLMPTIMELKGQKRLDLAQAINKYGGVFAVAERLSLKRSNDDKPFGYWDSFENVEREIRIFIEQNGTPEQMPLQKELGEAGRYDLANAISRYGSFFEVSRRLGLEYAGKQRVTIRTVESAETTARAIQPLAEAKLLSAGQIMLILRRAGLLDFRNQRVAKLTSSLARGNHAEIESSLSNLISSWNELQTETVEIQESDVLTSEEAQVLLNSETLSPPLRNPAESDTVREQAIIRGLSALGELRLPLDEVLQLLTSKVLWENFYKRLYHWYGSLDGAQTVTTQDVEAAILAAYPEHTANEFITDASEIFALEVEQAINFAVNLPDFGWQGPHLRLHQADAARRMSDVLSGESSAPFILNADDPGMGKSASFLAAVAVSGIQSIVLVAPKTVADDTWASQQGEIRRCLPPAKIVRGLPNALAHKRDSHLTFYLLHYEELLNEERVNEFAARAFDCLCLDEIHFVKQRAGQTPSHRRSALKILRSSARTAIGLTGTPLVNELAEPMSLLQVLSANAPQFDHSRLSNRRLRDIADVFESLFPHIVRRRKREVLLHLPDCDVQTVDIPMPDDLEREMLTVYGWPKLRAMEALVELRKIATDAKLSYLLSRAHAGRKILVLTYLTDEVSEKIFNYLDEFLPKQVTHINGSVPKAEREKILNSFRKPEGASVLVGTIGTIGVGITLFDPKQPETAHEVIFADLPYTYAEFEQGLARLHREGQKHRVQVDVLQTITNSVLKDGSAHQTLDERIWALIESKRELSDVAIDGKYDTTDATDKVLKALRRWLKQAREIGVEPLAIARRPVEQSPAQRWRSEIGRLRGMSAKQADEVFANPDYTQQFLEHLKESSASKLSHAWLQGKLSLLIRPELVIVDMGCGLNPFADFPCNVIGLDRHDRTGQLKGKMENPPLPDKSADVLIYSLSLYGTSADLFEYFKHAVRILRGGGHLFIIEPSSAFSDVGLNLFVSGLQKYGFELVGAVKELRGENDTLLKAMHLTLTGEINSPQEQDFERHS